MDSYHSLVSRIRERSLSTVIIGLGYVGLPLAALVAQAGFQVTGIERKPGRVSSVNRGRSYIEDLTDDDLEPLVRSGRLSATSEFSSISKAGVVAICVPTPLDQNKNPDTSYIEHVIEHSLPEWHRGQLVLLESTTYPGTTEEVILPRLQALGLEVGKDIFLAFSPERIDPGRKDLPLDGIPRVVGGITERCTEVARLFYEQVFTTPVFTVSSPRVAEMTKLFENVFRVVNVSLVNELAQLCERMNIDVWEVIDAAKTKPYGFMPFYPGPGVGGHCIPIDPFFLSWKAREYGFATRFIDLAGQINDGMPSYVVQQITEVLNRHGKALKGSKTLVLGVAFKRGVADTRESAALKVAARLLEQGAVLSYHDPFVPTVPINGHKFDSVQLSAENLSSSDVVVIGTDHSDVDYSLVAECGRLIYDTRNALNGFRGKHIHRLGAPEFAG